MKMKRNQGVTMVSLVVVIIIMIILSSVTIQVGIRVYNETKLQNYVSKLEVIQAKVDSIAEETSDVSSYGFTKLTDAASSDSEAYQIFISVIQDPESYNITDGESWDSSSDGVVANYYYFSPTELQSQLGLVNQTFTVAVNFETRNVIAKQSITTDDGTFHRMYELDGYELIN